MNINEFDYLDMHNAVENLAKILNNPFFDSYYVNGKISYSPSHITKIGSVKVQNEKPYTLKQMRPSIDKRLKNICKDPESRLYRAKFELISPKNNNGKDCSNSTYLFGVRVKEISDHVMTKYNFKTYTDEMSHSLKNECAPKYENWLNQVKSALKPQGMILSTA